MNKIVQKKRIDSIDLLKLIAIYLVILGHSLQYFRTDDFNQNELRSFIYIFHMPLFMMVSGLFLSKDSTRVFLKKRFIHIMVPAFCWGIIELLVIYAYGDNPSPTGGGIAFQDIDKQPITPLFFLNIFWFVNSLIICSVLVYFIHKLPPLYRYPLLIMTLSCSHWIPTYQLNSMYPSYICGVYLIKFIRNSSKKTSVFAGTLGIILFTIMYILQKHGLPQLDIFMYQLFEGLLVSSALIMLCFHLSVTSWLKSLSNYGRYTLGIYLLQSVLLERIIGRYICLDNTNEVVYTFAICPILSVFITILCIAILKCLEHYKTARSLLLGF